MPDGSPVILPKKALVALICDRWHCLPADVLKHDYFALMEVWNAAMEIERQRNSVVTKSRR